MSTRNAVLDEVLAVLDVAIADYLHDEDITLSLTSHIRTRIAAMKRAEESYGPGPVAAIISTRNETLDEALAVLDGMIAECRADRDACEYKSRNWMSARDDETAIAEAHARIAAMKRAEEPRCDQCDWTFSCFDGSTPCCKKRAEDGPPWLSDVAQALGMVRPSDGRPLALGEIRELVSRFNTARAQVRELCEAIDAIGDAIMAGDPAVPPFAPNVARAIIDAADLVARIRNGE